MTDSPRDQERARRLGLNEAVFREVNVRLEELADRFRIEPESLDLVCECGSVECAERIHLDRASYERLRSDPLTFAVVKGHEEPEVETVVEEHESCTVVRKQGPAAQQVAEETDPRSD